MSQVKGTTHMKFQMTRQGMQSLYTLAWREGAEQELAGSEDPIFSRSEPSEADVLEAEAELLDVNLHNVQRSAVLEEAVRTADSRERLLARREMDLLRLGYSGI
jgi:hypothetical protein